jgi:nucleoside-diphosphate-sugar epimerase
MRVAVTGASGFVGSALTRWLTARGHGVIAVSRRVGPPGPMQWRTIAGLEDVAGLRQAFQSAEVVVHLGARVHVMRETAANPLATFREANVAGTRAVHSAAGDAGAKRLVYLSSIKAMGEGRPEPYRESDIPRPVDPYGISKLEAEQALAVARVSGGIEFVVLRPTVVYGPGVGGNIRRLLRLAGLTRWLPLPLGGIANRRSLISVTNLASAIETAASHPRAADQTYLVSDGEDLSTSDLLMRMARGLGVTPRLLPCPAGLLRLTGRLTGLRGEVDRLLGSLVVDSARIRNELGWRPPQSVAEAIAETTSWWAGRRAAEKA